MKTKKMSFRIVTALLAVCMMLPLMPATGNVASAAGEREDVVVDFTTYKDENQTSSKYTVKIATIDDMDTYIDTYGWRLLKDTSDTSDGVYNAGNTIMMVRNGGSELWLEHTNHTYATIEFKPEDSSNFSGYYEVYVNILKSADSGFNTDVTVDGKAVGKFNCDATETMSGWMDLRLGVVKIDENTTHKFKLYRSDASTKQSGNNSYIYMKNIRFKPIEATEPAEQSIYFHYGRDGFNFPTDKAILDEKGWYMDSTATPSSVISDSWTRSTVDFSRLAFPAKNDVVTLKIKTLISGYYSANIFVKKYGTNSSTNGIIGDVAIDGVSLGNFDSTDSTNTGVIQDETEYKLGSIYLTEGEHTLTIKRLNETGGKILFLTEMSFTPSENTISTNEVFGNKYAYVKKSATGGYDVTFIGGLHKLTGYQTAGFKVLNGENEVADATTQVAYKSIIVSGDKLSKTPADYGVENDGYIFMAEAKGLAAGTYTVVPYVIDADDKVIEHNVTLTLTISE